MQPQTPQAQDQLDTFLDALSELSRKYRIGITRGELFEMEDQDMGNVYIADDDSKLLTKET